MPQLDGLETARQLCLKEHPPLIVFVTAYDAYALDAFDTAALDYLLKPVEVARLAKCIERSVEPTASRCRRPVGR